MNLHTLEGDVVAVLDRLAESFDTLEADFEAVEELRRQADPHLSRALDDPVGVPFRPDHPILREDLCRQFLPVMEQMTADYLRDALGDEQEKQALAEVMQRCLRATLLQEAISEEDRAVLEQAGDAADPLTLLCLYLCIAQQEPGNIERGREIIKQAQAARQRRVVSPEVGAYISSLMTFHSGRLSREDRGTAVEAFINDTADLWQKLSSPEADVSAHVIFMHYLSIAFDELFTNGKLDLLLELDSRRSPEVPRFVLHFVGAQILSDAAMHYRGGNYIMHVAADDLQNFQNLADDAAKQLLKAWTLAPYQPLFATLLMDLEMRAGNTPRSIDAWFRHATSAYYRVDYRFDVYEASVEEKWGGSLERQLWLAEKYVETEDLDTGIALRFINPLSALFRMSAEAPRRVFSNLQIQRLTNKFVSILKSHSLSEPHPRVGAMAICFAGGALWHAGEFEDLHWLLSVYSSKAESAPFHRFRLHPDELKHVSAAIVAEPTSTWLTAYRLLHGATRELSPADLDELAIAVGELRAADAAQGDADPALTAVIARWERLVAMLRSLQAGEMVTLSDEDLEDWFVGGHSLVRSFPNREPSGADSDAEDDAQGSSGATRVGTVDLEYPVSSTLSLLTCPILVDLPLSISMDVEITGNAPDPFGVSVLVGPHVRDMDRSGYRGVMLTVNNSHQQLVRNFLPVADWLSTVEAVGISNPPDKYSIRVEVFADGFRTFIGEQEIESVPVRLRPGGLVHIGRYCFADRLALPDTKMTYRISNLRLQRPAAAKLPSHDPARSSPSAGARRSSRTYSPSLRIGASLASVSRISGTGISLAPSALNLKLRSTRDPSQLAGLSGYRDADRRQSN